MHFFQSVQKIHTEASKLETEIAELKATIAELTEKLVKQATEKAELQTKDGDKADRLKAIQRIAFGVPETLTKMTFEDIKESFEKIGQLSTPGQLPLPVAETAEHPPPAATAKKSTHIPVRNTVTSLMRMNHPPSSQPQTSQQKNVQPRKAPNTTTKPTSTAKRTLSK